LFILSAAMCGADGRILGEGPVFRNPDAWPFRQWLWLYAQRALPGPIDA